MLGRGSLKHSPLAAHTIQHLDGILQDAHDAPSWSLYEELTADGAQVQRPELSQPLVTALQLALLALFQASNVVPQAVIGHSSGEIAAAVAAGYITPEPAILIAYYRGKATLEAVYQALVGMMAVGLGPDQVLSYLEGSTIEIACINSPQSAIFSGIKSELVPIEERIKNDGYFARLLHVDAAYHSHHIKSVAGRYEDLLRQHVEWQKHSKNKKQSLMASSTTGKALETPPGPAYWLANMVSPVIFSQAAHELTTGPEAVDCLFEIGPSDALSGPINQTKNAASSSVKYVSACKRGPNAISALLHAAGTLFMGYLISLTAFNHEGGNTHPAFVSDLPNYQWNHSVKYWHESESSHDWRFRKFPYHDLLGSKILSSPWTNPTWKNVLRLSDITWLRDHLLGDSVIFPAAGYIAMAIEAI
ncbi:hypothetical protein ASPTUDRAFT_203334 [Aspergillus tubingensis CBS 134.48]|uniref:PKS/mFAS DH domain-containing protein n=1 Tax=Aspergillus tubingensis (strain CBS 134.48) TaxID=767770 RepID=A0A1L9MZC6_ASPTC|nr:hypothetical protein ASPTUDRAFT_203334 [Aspergillus tubingensis CBS 134.48]